MAGSCRRPWLVALAAGLIGAMPAGAAGTRDCVDRPLVPGADLRRCDLRPLALATLDLNGADMRRATLAGLNLSGGPDGPRTNFARVRLDRADLVGVNFGSIYLLQASFRHADLRRTGWEDAAPTQADLSHADLRGAYTTLGGFSGTIFQGADLRDARLRSVFAQFSSAWGSNDFRRANLRRADLTRGDFAGALFQRADLRDANLTGARLGFASFAGADLRGVTWSNTTCPDGTNSDTNGGTCLGHL